jgi:hypothetical protein
LDLELLAQAAGVGGGRSGHGVRSASVKPRLRKESDQSLFQGFDRAQ